MSVSTNSGYLAPVYSRPEFLGAAVKVVSKEVLKIRPDAIAFSGSSGCAIAFPVASKIKIPMIHIRKDRGHHYEAYEGALDVSSYVILDDFVETGRTIKRIIEGVKTKSPSAKLLAAIFYLSDGSMSNKREAFYEAVAPKVPYTCVRDDIERELRK